MRPKNFLHLPCEQICSSSYGKCRSGNCNLVEIFCKLQLHKNKNYQLQLHESVQFITFNDVIVIDLSLIKDCLHFVNTQVCLRL